MTVSRKHFLCSDIKSQRGSSISEVILAVAVVLAVSPFLYNQIKDMSAASKDIAKANQIVGVRDDVINFLRINQNKWDDIAEIKLSDEELKAITTLAHSGYVDKYKVNGAIISDVYLAFDIPESDFRVANIVKQIGEDAAVVREDGVAYSQSWAVTAPDDFLVGDLIYKISRDFDSADKTKFLHRGTMGEDGLNKMQRNLHMNNFNVFNVNDIDAMSAEIIDAESVFLESDIVDANNVYFQSGANINSANTVAGSMRVTGDTNGFRLISADKLNGDKYTTNGRLIVDRATIANSLNVSGNLVLKSEYSKSISGFSGISMNKLLVPYLSVSDLVFYENFGITVSGELLLSGKAPLKIGSWSFPSYTAPSFSKFILTRASIPSVPDRNEFKKIISKDWQTN
nr:hypothetical protein [Candidatus Enterousia merdequi]